MFSYNSECEFNFDWCNSNIQKAIISLASSTKGQTGLNIEVGCFEGKSSVLHANVLYPEKIICVDPWLDMSTYEPKEEADFFIKMYKEKKVEDIFRHNMQVGTEGNYEVRQCGWQDVFYDWDYGSEEVKYLYLDGPHGYDEVIKQLETIYPYIKKGGVICGDDYADPKVSAAVNDFFKVSNLGFAGSPQTWFKVKD